MEALENFDFPIIWSAQAWCNNRYYCAKCNPILRNLFPRKTITFCQHATIASWNPLIFGQGYFAGKQTFFAIR